MVQELRFVLVEMPACREGMKYSLSKVIVVIIIVVGYSDGMIMVAMMVMLMTTIVIMVMMVGNAGHDGR